MTDATFGQFGRSFQERLVQALLVDHRWAEQLVEVFNVSYLDVKYLSFLADRYFAYARKYHVFPTLNLLVTIVRDELKTGTDVVIRDQIIDYLQRIRTNPNTEDLPYVKEKVLEFCRKQALKAAFESGIEKMQNEKYEQIVDDIRRAIAIGTVPVLGHNFFEDYEARLTNINRETISSGLNVLDAPDILNGGFGKGELSVIVGSAGTGKSHFLVFVGANAVAQGKNVLHYTFELSETYVGRRYDSKLCGIDASDVINHKQEIVDFYKANPRFGSLRIKAYPSGSVTINAIRAHVERLSLKGFIPDVMIVDYADIMRATRQYTERRFELKLIYEELRAFAAERNIPVITASQSNREGASIDVIDMTNMSEAYDKAMISDVILSISRRIHEKASGVGRLYVAKNRSGRDGLLYNIKIDTARSNFFIEEQTTVNEASNVDVDGLKSKIKKRWQELAQDGLVNA